MHCCVGKAVCDVYAEGVSCVCGKQRTRKLTVREDSTICQWLLSETKGELKLNAHDLV